jgi:hypothetical protein
MQQIQQIQLGLFFAAVAALVVTADKAPLKALQVVESKKLNRCGFVTTSNHHGKTRTEQDRLRANRGRL